MKKLKYLLFLSIIFLAPSVFADTSYDMTSLITSPVNFPECGVGSYTGVELNGATNCWNTNTRYQGTLNRIYFNLPAPTGTTFETDTAYRLTLKMATDDWRNNFGTVVVSPGSSYTNNFVDTFTFVSMRQINITFTVPYSGSTSYQYLWVNLPAKSSSHLITGVSNWNLSNITLTKLTSGSGGGSTTPSGPTTTFDDTAIINSAKDNTQDIINNNNTNTQDVINNNNQNTQQITDTIKDTMSNCYTNLINLSTVNTDDLSVSGYRYPVNLVSGKTYTLISYSGNFNFKISTSLNSYTDNQGFNNTNRYVFTYTPNSNLGTQQRYLMLFMPDTPGINISDKHFVLVEGNYSGSFISYNQEQCFSKIDDTTNAINSSTDTIINNQNQNTQQEIDSQKVCKFYDKVNIANDGKYLSSSGTLMNNANVGVTDYISVVSSTVTILTKLNSNQGIYACYYNSNKEKVSCVNEYDFVLGDITIPDNVSFVRFSIIKSLNVPTFKVCTNGNQALQESLTDSSVENGTGSDFFDDFTSQDFGLSQIITIPLNTIQSLTSKSCVPLQIPIPFTNSNVTLPCMTEIYENRFSTIYNLWKIVSFGIVAYLIAIDIFHIVKGFKDPESDKVEVLDL